jgi:hypothetical protein
MAGGAGEGIDRGSFRHGENQPVWNPQYLWVMPKEIGAGTSGCVRPRRCCLTVTRCFSFPGMGKALMIAAGYPNVIDVRCI